MLQKVNFGGEGTDFLSSQGAECHANLQSDCAIGERESRGCCGSDMPVYVQCMRQAFVAGSYWLGVAAAVLAMAAFVIFVVFRFIDPPSSALMLHKRLGGAEIDQRWVSLNDISPNLIRSVVQSEDARFCSHFGIDFIELGRALRDISSDGADDVRGASTISMQVVKNLVLWSDRSLIRKGLEIGITPIMELVWPKQRILEVYLNIAEWGPGIFGAEAAARRHFGKPARSLTRREAALLAAALPNPLRRRPARPNAYLERRAYVITRRSQRGGVDLSCLNLDR